jgi:hypothetical protein
MMLSSWFRVSPGIHVRELLVGVAGALLIIGCDPVRQFCNSDFDCASFQGQRCDIAASPPGECRATCGNDGLSCSASTTAPYPVGNNSDCQADDQCVCNPFVGSFFCEPQ